MGWVRSKYGLLYLYILLILSIIRSLYVSETTSCQYRCRQKAHSPKHGKELKKNCKRWINGIFPASVHLSIFQTMSGMPRGGAATNGNNSTGQNSWMNTSFPYPSAIPPAAYGQFGGGWHPSSWNGQSGVPPPPPSMAAANATAQATYNQAAFNYQSQAQQQNWNGYGKGHGGGAANYQQGHQKPQQFQPFALNRRNNQGAFPHINNSFVPQAAGSPQPLMGLGRGRGTTIQAAGPKPPPAAAQ